ncbi:nucleotide sugar dehydrogenase [Qingrenia yutianensis]|uniref:Nucleotide sugar dehydrogenase n=1 Tax=Qingrenia yutianensis TaxID=2763676 RepID=A0A926F7B2_9FIRM|nr:nucleotide sugar dehydrogenase [Qingrenia yutianensis]MBC8595310.1 nucleotide sugar dehydrogenase [Qingrenia yutianensis]
MSLCSDIFDGKEKISVIGLGYIGIPLAVSFAKKAKVIGFDINKEKIALYKSGIDPTGEVGNGEIKNTSVYFTSNPEELKNAKFHIVAVPTPVNQDHTPDLSPIEYATEILGKNLRKGSVAVFESTVYPGVTNDICIPILEKASGLKCGRDFKVGYSPERINPGDKIHRFETIKKIVSATDKDALCEVQNIYNTVIKAGTFPVSSIMTAEAVKVAENSQRDINIAFMNELAMVFDKMGIDTAEVIAGMNTKWNALKFYPGLVGGHCIGVDPYYFTYQAEKLGYHSQIILSGRKVNDAMGAFVADSAVKQIILADKPPKSSRAVILGITFKENCSDIRNSKVVSIVSRLKEYGINPVIADPMADKDEVLKEYNLNLERLENIKNADCVIIAAAHDCFKKLSLSDIDRLFKNGKNSEKVIIDVKSILNKSEAEKKGYRYWRL